MEHSVTAERVQLHRTKGWRKPENTVIVARPSVLGNPFRVVKTRAKIEPWQVVYVPDPRVDTFPHTLFVSEWATKLEAITDAIETYRDWATLGPNHYWRVQCFIDDWRLRGKNLACWCPLDQPCHADILLDLANPSMAVPA